MTSMVEPEVKRRDLCTRALLTEIAEQPPGVRLDVVAHFGALGFPRRVVLAAVMRECRKGLLTFGPDGLQEEPWPPSLPCLTEEGRVLMGLAPPRDDATRANFTTVLLNPDGTPVDPA